MKIKMQTKDNQKTVEDAFNEFIQYCKVRNLAPDTIIFYRNTYKKFINHYPPNRVMNDINYSTIQSYILELGAKELNTITINSYLRGIRAFLYFSMRFDYLTKFALPLLKTETQAKEVYTDAELRILLQKPTTKTCLFSEYRNWVVINYALGTGNRVNTIINIKIKDIDFENGFISLLKTKNKKYQIIPLSGTLSTILAEYLTYRKGTPDDYLFCNSLGTRLCDRSLQGDVARYNRRRGITKTSMHLFRHTFAKKWILSGGDIFRLQKILGHSTLHMVKDYLNLFSPDLKIGFDKFNALEQILPSTSHISMKRK